jgi:hypothetical protein
MGPVITLKKCIKKGKSSLSFNARGFTTPMNMEVLKLLSSNGLCSFSRKDFVEKYDLCYLGISAKKIRLPRDCLKEEIKKCFGHVVNKNKHRSHSI